tara:strand:+ start:173 stop:298 length:126 start_codon:yes stop_codon:yes gene_type:complete
MKKMSNDTIFAIGAVLFFCIIGISMGVTTQVSKKEDKKDKQ